MLDKPEIYTKYFSTGIKLSKDLDKIISSLPIPIYLEDVDSSIIGANEPIISELKWSARSDYVGKSLYELYPEKMADHIKQHNDDVIRLGQAMSQEESIINSIGELQYYFAFKTPLYDDHRNIIGLVGTSINITQQREAAKMLAQLLPKQQDISNIIKVSNRELECIKLLKEGFSSKQIACILNISNRTVEQYIDTARNKLGCKNSVELIYKCVKNGILS